VIDDAESFDQRHHDGGWNRRDAIADGLRLDVGTTDVATTDVAMLDAAMPPDVIAMDATADATAPPDASDAATDTAPRPDAAVDTGTPLHSVTVSSITALLDALADNTLDEIVLTNGTYHVSTAGSMHADSLWIGARFAGRTRPIIVRAQTDLGVTIDGGGAQYFGGLTFTEGSHDQTWRGFRFGNGEATETGVVVIGGYPTLAPPHHITLQHFDFLPTITGPAVRGNSSYCTAHHIYTSVGTSSPHDITLEDISGDAGYNGVCALLHAYHSPNVVNLVARRFTARRYSQAIIIWDDTVRNWTLDGFDVQDSDQYSLRFGTSASTGRVSNFVSQRTGVAGLDPATLPSGWTNGGGNSFH
jgi:hypothetical protein